MPALFLVFEGDAEGFDPGVNGREVARRYDDLERRAQALGLPGLSAYTCVDPAEAVGYLEDAGLGPEDVELPPVAWFAPAEGLALIQALLADLGRQDPALREDLEGFAQVLSLAEAHGLRWHAEWDV